MDEASDRTTVTILFKSGAKVHVECKDFKVQKQPTGVGILELTILAPKPRNVFIDLGEVAALFEGEA